MAKGILIDYEFCSGCHTCEMACDVELTHDFEEGHCGIKLFHEGPYKIGPDTWSDINYPVITDLCDLCAQRIAAGASEPTCVKHCQARVLKYGEIDDLIEGLKSKPKQILFAL